MSPSLPTDGVERERRFIPSHCDLREVHLGHRPVDMVVQTHDMLVATVKNLTANCNTSDGKRGTCVRMNHGVGSVETSEGERKRKFINTFENGGSYGQNSTVAGISIEQFRGEEAFAVVSVGWELSQSTSDVNGTQNNGKYTSNQPKILPVVHLYFPGHCSEPKLGGRSGNQEKKTYRITIRVVQWTTPGRKIESRENRRYAKRGVKGSSRGVASCFGSRELRNKGWWRGCRR